MNLLEYWKKRCELAEAYIDESPCDPDIYKEQLDAWNNWLEFKKLRIHDVVGRSEQLVCDCGNKLTDKEIYFGQCLQCDKNIEEAN